MSSLTTLARPYAKAAFKLAQADKALQAWDERLALAAAIAGDEMVLKLIKSPHVDSEQALALITDACGDKLDDRFCGYLALLGEIKAIYGRLRQQAERRMVARVVSAIALSDEQRERLKRALSERYDADVELENEIDPSVIGGAVIHAGIDVIDGSLRGRLRKLEQSLVS
jgi:F-type H+-transporting ATPase subunit delta